MGYLQFRFTFQGEFINQQAGQSSLFVWDLQLLPTHQRKGLGKHMMSVIELIARKNKMAFVQLLVPEVQYLSFFVMRCQCLSRCYCGSRVVSCMLVCDRSNTALAFRKLMQQSNL